MGRTQEERRARSGFVSEAAFVASVAQQLREDGWHCRQEVRTRYGRIDLLAQRDSVSWIIEAKLSMKAADVTCALGQLLCGLTAYPDAGCGLPHLHAYKSVGTWYLRSITSPY